ncbi:MAG: M4 family metallopeptidase [Actinomycetota bacterium]
MTRLKEPARSGGPVKVALDHLASNRSLYAISEPRSDLAVETVTRDRRSASVRFNQEIDGVPVAGATYIVHLERDDGQHAPASVNGHYFTEIEAATSAAFSLDVARSLVRKLARPVVVSRVEDHGLKVLPVAGGVLTYHFTVSGSVLGRTARREVFVNARTGALTLAYDNLQADGPVSTTGLAAHPGEELPLEAYQRGALYELRDQVTSVRGDQLLPNVEITTHDSGKGDPFRATNGNIVTSATARFEGHNTEIGAVDAHWGLARTYEYFAALGWNSIDGEGMPIRAIVDASDPATGGPMFNAFWDGEQMVFGNPDPDELYPFSAALDIVAHELTHGITENSGNLFYLNQSGAVNEAFSDYFGEAVEVTARGLAMSDPEVGKVGEDLCKVDDPVAWSCPLRDLNDSRRVDDYLFYLTDFDNGGVHDNATIFGGALWDIRERLGGPTADQYILKALTEYVTPLMDFYDARLAVEGAVQDPEFGGETNPDVNVVREAFNEHGITETWESAQASDADVLFENVSPTGSLFSPPRSDAKRFVVASYESPTDACCEPIKLFVGDVDGSEPMRTVGQHENPTTFNDELPDISGRRAVWAHFTLTPDGFDSNVKTRLLSGRVRNVANARGFQWYPAVDGARVVWEDTRRGQTDIYTRRVGGRTKRVSRALDEQWLPDVSGRWISFWDVGDGVRDRTKVMAKNVRSGRRIVVEAPTKSATIGPPTLGSRHMYWWQDDDGDGTGEIMRVRLARGTRPRTVVAEDSPFAPVWQGVTGALVPPVPSANADFVAYSDESDYVTRFVDELPITNENVGRNVYVVPVAGGTPRLVTENRGDQAYPAIADGDQVLWLDGSMARTDLMTNR